jgi:hypothetical protein
MQDFTPSPDSRKRGSRKSKETPDLSFNSSDLETPTDKLSDNGDAREPESTTNIEFDPAALESPASKPSANGSAPDPFDPIALRLPQDFSASLGVRKTLLSVPLRKPDKSWFVRVHPDPAYRLQTAVIELKEDRGAETYLVSPALWPDLATEATFSPRALFTAINRLGVVFLWPIRLPGSDGRQDEWSRTALEAADMAAKGWVRVSANMQLGAYDLFQAPGNFPDPEWPDLPFRDLLRIGFKDRFISDRNHTVLRKLRGEV